MEAEEAEEAEETEEEAEAMFRVRVIHFHRQKTNQFFILEIDSFVRVLLYRVRATSPLVHKKAHNTCTFLFFFIVLQCTICFCCYNVVVDGPSRLDRKIHSVASVASVASEGKATPGNTSRAIASSSALCSCAVSMRNNSEETYAGGRRMSSGSAVASTSRVRLSFTENSRALCMAAASKC